ncbi:MAG: transposase [Geodermatophilaceae bacterium]
MAADSEFTPTGAATRRVCAGSSTLTGFALAVEIGDWHRFTGNTIGSFVGLVPSEYSSGASRVAGLDHQDRQHPRPPAARRGRLAPPRPLRRRQDHARPVGTGPTGSPRPRRRGQPAPARSGGSRFNVRTQDAHVIANVAIARELAGWCWSLAVLDGVPADHPSRFVVRCGWQQRVERPAIQL